MWIKNNFQRLEIKYAKCLAECLVLSGELSVAWGGGWKWWWVLYILSEFLAESNHVITPADPYMNRGQCKKYEKPKKTKQNKTIFWFKSYCIHLYWYVANCYKLRGLNIHLVFLFPGSGIWSWPCWVLCRASHKATIKVSDHPSLDQ